VIIYKNIIRPAQIIFRLVRRFSCLTKSFAPVQTIQVEFWVLTLGQTTRWPKRTGRSVVQALVQTLVQAVAQIFV
jgi:hypothetical protein